VLDLYKACLEELEKLFDAQTIRLAELESRMDSGMCWCGSNVKRKGREVVPVEEDVLNVLGSPIVLPTTISTGSNSSYLTPPIANESSSAEVEESLVSPLVLMNDEDKENQPRPSIGVVNAYHRFKVLQGGSMDA